MRKEIVFMVLLLVLLVSSAFAIPVTLEEVIKVAGTFLEAEQLRWVKMPELTPKAISDAKAGKTFLAKNVGEVSSTEGVILAYVVELSPEGFIIISADTDMRPVLGYSFGGEFPFQDSPQNALLHLVQWDVEARLRVFSQPDEGIRERVAANALQWVRFTSEREDVLAETASSLSTQWGPWITTNWYQSGHYNDKCPYISPSVPVLGRRPVGCVATAMAQIIKYWEYPSCVHFDYSSDHYDTKTGIDIDGDASTYGFPTFSELASALCPLSYVGDPVEEAYFCFGAGVKLEMNYGISGSGANTYRVAGVLRDDFSFSSAIPKADRSGVWSENRSKVIENMKSGWPVQIAIHKSGEDTGHSVVVDGYRDSDEYFHVNLGWSGTAEDTWYNIPNIKSYNVVHTVVHDISIYKGWSQHGADEKNTFRSPYGAPSEDESKWQISTGDTEYDLGSLVIGTGNNIYATCLPTTFNQGGSKYGYIWVIRHDGDVTSIKKILLPGENQDLGRLAQSSNGYVFVGTELGNIWRIDPITENAVHIVSGLANISRNFKIDSDDYLYFANSYTLYSYYPSGIPRWSFTPGGNKDIKPAGSTPAIDAQRNRVYVAYYDWVAKITYLGWVRRDNGGFIDERPWTITSSALIAGSPSIGSDGTVYIAVGQTLYALDPDNLKGPAKWIRPIPDDFLINERIPAIGPDGTIYITYPELHDTRRDFVLAAIDPSDGTIKYRIRHQGAGEDDKCFQPYVTQNKVVIFPTKIQEGEIQQVYKAHAYKDEGSYFRHLWSHYYGDYEADLALGPGRTIYLIANEREIHAVSEEGAGMGYTDNHAPAIISNPNPPDRATDQPTDLTLCWSCSDPDEHSLKYDVYLCVLVEGEEAAFVPVATQITSNCYNPAGLEQGVQYLWSVVATDGQAVTEGPTWSFTTLLPPCPNVCGDCNGDGGVSPGDAQCAFECYLGTAQSPCGCEECYADVNCDGSVTPGDAQLIFEHYLDPNTPLNCCP